MLFTCGEIRCFIKFVCQSMGWSTKRTRTQILIKKWAVSSVEDQCKMQKMNLIEHKTDAKRPQTARSEHYYRHVTELICSQEGNTGSSKKSKRNDKPDSDIYLSVLAAARSCHGYKHVITNVFSHCVKMLLGCFDYIVIILCKILTHLSGFGFILV